MLRTRRELTTLTVFATVLFLASACGTSVPKTQPAGPATTTRPAAITRPPAVTSPASPVRVYGDLRFYIVPGAPAVRPVGGITVALVIRSLHGGAETTWNAAFVPEIKGLWFEFTQLPPGRYRLKALDLKGAGLSPDTVAVPTGGPAFTVPASGCAYVGLITLVFYRLPPGTPSQQASAAGQLAHGKAAYFVYLKTGGLLGSTAAVGPLPASERPAGSQTCAVRLAKF